MRQQGALKGKYTGLIPTFVLQWTNKQSIYL